MTYVADAARYSVMNYRRSGRSGLKLPELSLRLWQNFGDTRPLEFSGRRAGGDRPRGETLEGRQSAQYARAALTGGADLRSQPHA